MKVFEVLFDYSIGDEKEITREVVYWSGDFESVSKHAIEHASVYDRDLIGIRDVLTVTQDCGLSDETE